MNEFDIINKFAMQSCHRKDIQRGIGDDCAVLRVPENQTLLVTTDTLNEGIHFLKRTNPYCLGQKALAVSLSDLAAMGGEPAWFLLNLTTPDPDEKWLNSFAEGLMQLANHFNMQLVGGDTTQGPLAITTTVMGFAPATKVIYRSGAKPGDLVYVTGTLGNAALALKILKQEIRIDLFEVSDVHHYLDSPTPRIQEGLRLRDIASSAIDISDGLAADLNHILKESNVGATIDVLKLPLSTYMKKLPFELAIEFALSGGDDYELLFTVPANKENLLRTIQTDFGCEITLIGQIEANPDLRLCQNGVEINLTKLGYMHFE